jgi:hypothetical protein
MVGPRSSGMPSKHALVQDAAYASLLRRPPPGGRTCALPRGSSRRWEAPPREPQLIAWHFAEASAPDKSIAYYSKAADHATGRFCTG